MEMNWHQMAKKNMGPPTQRLVLGATKREKGKERNYVSQVSLVPFPFHIMFQVRPELKLSIYVMQLVFELLYNFCDYNLP